MKLDEYQALLEKVLAFKVRDWKRAQAEKYAKEWLDACQWEVNGLAMALRLTNPKKYDGVNFIDGWQDPIPEPPDGWDALV